MSARLTSPSSTLLSEPSDLLHEIDAAVAAFAADGKIVCANRMLRDLSPGKDINDVAALGSLGNELWREFVVAPTYDATPRKGAFFINGKRYRATRRIVHAPVPLVMITLSDLTDPWQSVTNETMGHLAEVSDTAIQQAIELKHEAQRLEQRVMRRTAQLHRANLDAVWMLAVASEAKDQGTGDHVRRVEHYSHLLATALGMPEEGAETLGISSILHDVGKIHVPDAILSKEKALDPAERTAMQEHTLIGERILSRNAFFRGASRIARSHHENWDGSGYPDALAGDAIPMEARVVHLADVYDALATARPYKEAWPMDITVETILAARGRMFDPAVVDAFMGLVKAEKWPHEFAPEALA
jgi:HD-GYP domain-containing protein (c-di-GMP phosphodiesterase class II)